METIEQVGAIFDRLKKQIEASFERLEKMGEVSKRKAKGIGMVVDIAIPEDKLTPQVALDVSIMNMNQYIMTLSKSLYTRLNEIHGQLTEDTQNTLLHPLQENQKAFADIPLIRERLRGVREEALANFAVMLTLVGFNEGPSEEDKWREAEE
mgnify:CR=1 FL=1